jgi:UTP--glucose-1-phosphate uridylyltransferase
MADIWYIRQKEQSRLGNAILMAKEIVGQETFAVLLPHVIIDVPVPALKG